MIKNFKKGALFTHYTSIFGYNQFGFLKCTIDQSIAC